MKATELIAALQNAVDRYGDMDIMVRYPEDGSCWNDITIFPDPPSPMEKELGIRGSIDINVCASENNFAFKGSYVCEDTPLGTLVAESSSDPDHPGVYVFLRKPGCGEEIVLALVEFTDDDDDDNMPKEGGIVTRIWMDADPDAADYSHRFFHKTLTSIYNPFNHE